jgi:hypothetical protein
VGTGWRSDLGTGPVEWTVKDDGTVDAFIPNLGSQGTRYRATLSLGGGTLIFDTPASTGTLTLHEKDGERVLNGSTRLKNGTAVGGLELRPIGQGTALAALRAQPAWPRRLVVGDTWRLSNGSVVTVVEVGRNWHVRTGNFRECPACRSRFEGGALVAVTGPNGESMEARRFGTLFIGPDWTFFRWPLEVGKEWQISSKAFFRGDPLYASVNVTVKGVDVVTTPAGTFKAFRIEQEWIRKLPNAGMSWSQGWRNTLWYSVDAKSVVKFESNARGGQTWELTAYSVR